MRKEGTIEIEINIFQFIYGNEIDEIRARDMGFFSVN